MTQDDVVRPPPSINYLENWIVKSEDWELSEFCPTQNERNVEMWIVLIKSDRE